MSIDTLTDEMQPVVPEKKVCFGGNIEELDYSGSFGP